jgi:hypothetical protein
LLVGVEHPAEHQFASCVQDLDAHARKAWEVGHPSLKPKDGRVNPPAAVVQQIALALPMLFRRNEFTKFSPYGSW